MTGGVVVSVGHLALILVEALDRRLHVAANYAAVLRADDVRALHLAVDGSAAHEFATAWGQSGMAAMPIAIAEVGRGGVASAAKAAIRELACGFDRVTVVVPVVATTPPARRLHHTWAPRAAEAAKRLPGVVVAVVPVPVDG